MGLASASSIRCLGPRGAERGREAHELCPTARMFPSVIEHAGSIVQATPAQESAWDTQCPAETHLAARQTPRAPRWAGCDEQGEGEEHYEHGRAF
jgi:hypothetical protein